ncbi:oligosaccharyl transferase subunit [Colletotrichum karsti]|uniref:Oligosaccharyl transferase subunit n=1 Tax=Colletotrichum karsti TaxID=1095194 RepID=A0A9P6IKA5_9PEZI|nr:oligosaccharyl transferase subunit [Colletotrichum karsti]KAF9882445.1 oligosaccharyl transferase subunit [Colletotrichum karsti]
MRFLRSLLAATSFLAAGSLAAKKTTEERFNDFHTKALSSSPIKLADTSYKSLTASPRDYTVAVLLTALESRFGCQLCREFQPEWDLLGKSWTKGDKKGESRLLFGTLDFADGREIFMSLGLQTAPVLLLFQPTVGPHAVPAQDPLQYDFTSGPQSAEQVHAWLARHLTDRPHPAIKRPINWMRWISTITIVLGLGTVAVTASPYILPIIQNRNLWAAVSLIAILLFTSGHMFNHIRKVPYVAGDGRGGISYFAGGFQNQFGLETQIIAAIYGVLAFCAISLTVKVPRIGDSKTQQVAVLAWGGVLFLMYSFLLSVFRIKNGGYPFSLPPFM